MIQAPQSSPWTDPPRREKTLRRRRAEKQARRAKHWGDRLEEARQDGPERLTEVTFDRLRKELESLPPGERDRAHADVTRSLERIRQQYAQ